MRIACNKRLFCFRGSISEEIWDQMIKWDSEELLNLALIVRSLGYTVVGGGI